MVSPDLSLVSRPKRSPVITHSLNLIGIIDLDNYFNLHHNINFQLKIHDVFKIVFTNTLKLKWNFHFLGFHVLILERVRKNLSVFILLSEFITCGKYFYLHICALHIFL